MLRSLGIRFVVGKVGSDCDLDRLAGNIDQHHLKGADRDLQAAQQLADALAISCGGVLNIVAVRHRYLFTGRERDFCVGALRARDDNALLRDVRRAVEHADRIAVGDQIQRVRAQLGRTVQQHHRGEQHEEHRSPAVRGCEQLFQKLLHEILLFSRREPPQLRAAGEMRCARKKITICNFSKTCWQYTARKRICQVLAILSAKVLFFYIISILFRYYWNFLFVKFRFRAHENSIFQVYVNFYHPSPMPRRRAAEEPAASFPVHLFPRSEAKNLCGQSGCVPPPSPGASKAGKALQTLSFLLVSTAFAPHRRNAASPVSAKVTGDAACSKLHRRRAKYASLTF